MCEARTGLGEKGCEICGGAGEVHRRATRLGYERKPEWDDVDEDGRPREGWLTPSGLKMMAPKRGHLMLSTMCDCLRRRYGLKLIAEIGGWA